MLMETIEADAKSFLFSTVFRGFTSHPDNGVRNESWQFVVNLCTVIASLPLWVMKAQKEERERNFLHLLATEDQNLISNATETDCPICFSPLEPQEGIVLRECLHTFCRSDTMNHFVFLSYVVKGIKVFFSAF